jgi:hypothetical protein
VAPAGAIRTATFAALVVVGVGACGGADGAGPDAGTIDAADGAADGGTEPGGLHLRLRATPSLPASLGGDHDVTVDQLALVLDDLRLVGDAAPGDARTRIERAELEWPGDDVRTFRFPEAPPGVYAYVLATIDRFRFAGEVTLEGEEREGEDHEYELEDEQASLALSIALPDLVLEPGGERTIDLIVDVAAVVGPIDWSAAPTEEDEIELEDDHPIMDGVRDRLVDGGISLADDGEPD